MRAVVLLCTLMIAALTVLPARAADPAAVAKIQAALSIAWLAT